MCNPSRAIGRAIGNETLSGDLPPPPPPSPPPPPPPAPTPTTPAPPAPPPIDYAGLASGYVNYARPQIESQYGRARDALQLGLAERGLASSNIAKNYDADLTKAYDSRVGDLPNVANQYAYSAGANGSNYTPLGDLFTNLIKPVATFNANNRYTAPDGMAPLNGSNAVGSGGSSGTSDIKLSRGNSARVVN